MEGAPTSEAFVGSEGSRAVDRAGLRIREYGDLDALPPGYSDLLDAEGRRHLVWGRPWLGAVFRHGALLDRTPRLLGVEDAAGRPVALCVGFSYEHYAEVRNCRGLVLQMGEEPYHPLAIAGISSVDVLRIVARFARRSGDPYDVLRIGPLDGNGELFSRLPSILRAEGWIQQRFFMFSNWYEDVSGRNSAEYLRARPSRLQSTIKRRGRNLEKLGNARVEMINTDAALTAAIWDYEHVFGRSWKHGLTGVPYQRTVMQVAARERCLRLALLYLDDVPAAAQFWLVSGGIGYLQRTAYDQSMRGRSPGTVLTWHVVRHLLDVDRVRELDLGVGDDAYKADWASGRRERWGILAFNPRTWAGLKAAAYNVGGRAGKRILRAMLGRR